MEGYAVDYGDEEERPVRAAFGLRDVDGVVDREEYVCCAVKIGQDLFESEGLGGIHEHVGHGGAEEDDGGFGEASEFFAFEVSIVWC